MLADRNLIVDTFSDVHDLLKPWITHEFWDFGSHEIVTNSIYVIGRKQVFDNTEKVQQLLNRPDLTLVFDNVAEGSITLVRQLQMLGLDEFAQRQQILLISGGNIDPAYTHVHYEHFLTSILKYSENIQSMQAIDNIFKKTDKPYKFLFLNGRARPHRKYLWERFNQSSLLNHALWTILDNRPCVTKDLVLKHNGRDLMATLTPIQWLPEHYEFSTYRSNKIASAESGRVFIKNELFNNEWGEIYLEPAPYIDTYFSLVTETVFDYPYSFKTEKIAKPLAIGHPFVVAANAGFYRDLHKLGFRTFGHVIDETFDQIDNHQDRLDRIVAVVNDLCQQDLPAFLADCRDVCKYNQQHLQELAPALRQKFPTDFFNLVQPHG